MRFALSIALFYFLALEIYFFTCSIIERNSRLPRPSNPSIIHQLNDNLKEHP